MLWYDQLWLILTRNDQNPNIAGSEKPCDKRENVHPAPFLNKWEDERTKADEWLDFIVECLTVNLLS